MHVYGAIGPTPRRTYDTKDDGTTPAANAIYANQLADTSAIYDQPTARPTQTTASALPVTLQAFWGAARKGSRDRLVTPCNTALY